MGQGVQPGQVLEVEGEVEVDHRLLVREQVALEEEEEEEGRRLEELQQFGGLDWLEA